MNNKTTEYHYHSAQAVHDHRYLTDPITEILTTEVEAGTRLFELGCGNGYNAKLFSQRGFDVVAVDSSESGIEMACKDNEGVHFEVASAYENLSDRFGVFPTVVSIEVVEHLFSPRKYAETVFQLLQDNGTAIITTPYHGYLKNLAIALSGKFDSHVNPLWEGGHIKFWSTATLQQLLKDAGFKSVEFRFAGRVPWLAKSMIAIARK